MAISPPDPASLENLLLDAREGVVDGLLPARVFNDPRIHELEIERVFTRAWTFIGHESEIPHPGDYVLRYVGNDTFIFIRDEDGVVRLIFDACRHRGAQVCRAETGNASHFRCSYHGWTYKNTGELVGAPGFRDAYGGGRFDRKDWGLLQAPNLDSVHGFYFASLDRGAPSLDEYLGDMRWYLDLLFGLAEDGLEVVAEPQRWVIQGNWKNPADQFAGDDYHTLFLHKSMWEVGVIQIPATANMMGYHIQAGNGHVLSFSMAPSLDDPGPKHLGYPEDLVTTTRLTPEQREIGRRARVMVGTVFPNFGFLAVPLTTNPKIPPIGMTTVQMFRPLGPDRVEVWAWYLVWKGMSQEQKEQSYLAALATFSSSGTFEQDDAEPWQSIARTGASAFARRENLQFNFQMGLEGIGCSQPATDFPGPGIAFWPRYEEGIQRSLYRRWLDFMTSDGYPATDGGNGSR